MGLFSDMFNHQKNVEKMAIVIIGNRVSSMVNTKRIEVRQESKELKLLTQKSLKGVLSNLEDSAKGEFGQQARELLEKHIDNM